MTLAIEFFTAVSTASNQVEDDRITVIVTRILKAYFRNKKIDVASNANSNANLIDESRSFIKEWTCKDIEFFDSNYEKNELIVNVDKHVFYRNVYAFIDRLKDMTMHRESNKIRNVISQCFREFALIWHSAELSNLEKNMLKKTSLTMWYNALIKRFKQRISVALISIQSSRYTMNDARKQVDSRIFAQDLFRHAKIVDFTSIHN